MFEKVNKYHPDKVADRVAGAIVDKAYELSAEPHIAVEVLLGHGHGLIIVETDVSHELLTDDIIRELSPVPNTEVLFVPQDKHLNDNQKGAIRCGDNGIFRGCPVTKPQKLLTNFAKRFDTDGKYLITGNCAIITVCQSSATDQYILSHIHDIERLAGNNIDYTINPIGSWAGGLDVDTGATNRKLGSDMGDAVTGGGLHGKDLSKADVSVNIYLHIIAQLRGHVVEAMCDIGDEDITVLDTETDRTTTVPYAEVVRTAKEYIDSIGGFEKFAEWGLIR